MAHGGGVLHGRQVATPSPAAVIVVGERAKAVPAANRHIAAGSPTTCPDQSPRNGRGTSGRTREETAETRGVVEVGAQVRRRTVEVSGGLEEQGGAREVVVVEKEAEVIPGGETVVVPGAGIETEIEGERGRMEKEVLGEVEVVNGAGAVRVIGVGVEVQRKEPIDVEKGVEREVERETEREVEIELEVEVEKGEGTQAVIEVEMETVAEIGAESETETGTDRDAERGVVTETGTDREAERGVVAGTEWRRRGETA